VIDEERGRIDSPQPALTNETWEGVLEGMERIIGGGGEKVLTAGESGEQRECWEGKEDLSKRWRKGGVHNGADGRKREQRGVRETNEGKKLAFTRQGRGNPVKDAQRSCKKKEKRYWEKTGKGSCREGNQLAPSTESKTGNLPTVTSEKNAGAPGEARWGRIISEGRESQRDRGKRKELPSPRL